MSDIIFGILARTNFDVGLSDDSGKSDRELVELIFKSIELPYSLCTESLR